MSAKLKPTTGVWGQSPQRGPRAEPSRGFGGEPHEAERLFALSKPGELANCPKICYFAKQKNSPDVWGHDPHCFLDHPVFSVETCLVVSSL